MRLTKTTFRWRERALYLVAAALLVALDRLTKNAIAQGMELYSSHEIIPGLFNLVHTRNTGIAFSLLNDSAAAIRLILVPLISVAAVILIIYLFLNSEAAERRTNWALTLILAGAAGNLYDRVVYGYVVDFLDFYVSEYHWPAFNVADTCITVGAGLLLLGTLRGTARQPEEAESA